MTIEERAELAVETFAAGKGNCTQSVLCAWEDKIPVDHEMLRSEERRVGKEC